jgi:hypothetical protein
VLNRENRLVGILSSRDVSASLLVELHNEYHKLEAKLPVSVVRDVNTVTQQFRVERFDFENAGKVAHAIKKILSEQNYPPGLIRRVAVAAYEMEINLVVHSLGGTFTFHMDPHQVELLAADEGPGIPNVEQAMQEGFTTANEWIQLAFATGPDSRSALRRPGGDAGLCGGWPPGIGVAALPADHGVRCAPPPGYRQAVCGA